MDSWTYRHLLAEPNKSCPIPHHYLPSHNLLSLDTLLEVSPNLNGDLLHDGPEFLSHFPCYQSFPYAVQKSSVLFCGSRVVDDATMLVKNKLIWERKLKRLRLSNIEIAIKKIKELRKNKIVKVSKKLKEYIEHFHRDPVPKFSGDYNWLYTGGCLSCDEGCNGSFLIGGDFFNKRPGFRILKLNESLNEIQHEYFASLKTHTPVLQIACKAKDEKLFISTRQKNFLTLFSADKMFCDSHPVKLWRKKVAPAKLLTCIDVRDNCEELGITDSSHDLHIYDIEKKVKVFGHSGRRIANDYNRNCWSQMVFGEFGIYWALRNCLVVMDQRAFNPVQLEYSPATATNSCEEISCFVKSPKDPNYMYLGTTHSVLQIDWRNGKTVQKWTHLMKTPPQFMTVVEVEDKNEVLVLQSKTVDETLGIVNKCSDDGGQVHFLSTSLPCLLKSIKESFNLARFNGLCLSPLIAKRMDFAVTGMQSLKNSQNDIILFTANSGGDIFQRQIKKKTSEQPATEEDDQEVLKTMRMYETHCEKFRVGNSPNKHLKLTDMSHVLKGLEQKRGKKTKTARKPEIHWPVSEMYAPESLLFFKDVLAQKILKVWGYHNEESPPECADMSVDSKVREWMEKC